MELNEYDKEFLVGHSHPVKELRLLLSNIKPWEKDYELKVKDCKDFTYNDKQVYCYNSKYYYN
mgnify:CR=1 FL=1|tara:strand:- start:12199 stop:12387 length:189 start_codon:yes stop_codon:yes gene_type:complete